MSNNALASRYMSVKDAAAELGVTSDWVLILCNRGEIDGATKISKNWILPRSAIQKLKVERGDMAILNDKGYVSTIEAAKILDMSSQRVIRLCNMGRIAGAVRVGRLWKIPLLTLQSEQPITPPRGESKREIHKRDDARTFLKELQASETVVIGTDNQPPMQETSPAPTSQKDEQSDTTESKTKSKRQTASTVKASRVNKSVERVEPWDGKGELLTQLYFNFSE